MEDQSRRELFRIVAGAAVAVPAMAQQAQQPAPAPKFFTPEEFRMVDELSEIIIPADDHSPGARAAGVAAYIDKEVAEAFIDTPRTDWREGLKLVDNLSREMNGKAFLEATPEQRVDVVARMAQNEKRPKSKEEIFFSVVKHRTAHAYYTSDIGIHKEIEYKGNVLLNQFVGYDAGSVPVHATPVPPPPES